MTLVLFESFIYTYSPTCYL